VVPVAQGGQATVANLRLLCAGHNKQAARRALGEPAAAARWGLRPRGMGTSRGRG